MIYLTYNDLPSGIYSSQVIDVCKFLSGKLNIEIRLVAIVSLRGYFRSKERIKSELPNAIILPMFPKARNWKFNKALLVFLLLIIGKQSIIARGPFAAALALSMRNLGFVNRVCFDGRGAYDREFKEYDIAGSSAINNEIFSIEKNAVLNSDFRIAVSQKLVSYWNEMFGYNNTMHVIIPCTLNSMYFKLGLDEKFIKEKRESLGYSETDVIYVYSGSSSEWQSLGLIDKFMADILKKNINAKALFLSNSLPGEMSVFKIFPGRVDVKYLKPAEVPGILSCCDYGLLIRTHSMTNAVASPVKFAEYLAAGLKVIISENIGDYSDFVRQNNCGYVLASSDNEIKLSRPTQADKEYNTSLAVTCFRKEKYLEKYLIVYKNLV